MILKRFILMVLAAFCNCCYSADLAIQNTKLVELVGKINVAIPAEMEVRQKIDMEDFALYEFFDHANKILLRMYLGNHPAAPSKIKKDSVVSEEVINDLKIKFITNRSKPGSYQGEFYIRIGAESGWPNTAHVVFQKLSAAEYVIVKNIAISLVKTKAE